MDSLATTRGRIEYPPPEGRSNGQVAPTDGRAYIIGAVPLISHQRHACQHGRRSTTTTVVPI